MLERETLSLMRKLFGSLAPSCSVGAGAEQLELSFRSDL